MTDDHTCLNPNCENRIPVIGVCSACANGSYQPKRHGIDVPGYES